MVRSTLNMLNWNAETGSGGSMASMNGFADVALFQMARREPVLMAIVTLYMAEFQIYQLLL